MSVLIYWLGIRLYVLAATIASLFNPKAKLFVQGRRGLLKKIHYTLIGESRERIWVHCASLGEFEQARPVIEQLKEKYPTHAIVITFFSPSGYQIRKDFEGADYVFYLPYDSAYNAKKFLKLVQPSLAVFVKYEFWYFYLKTLSSSAVPTILISAIFRVDQPFFKWYGGLHRKMLHCFDKIFVQDDTSQRLLTKIGIDDVVTAGDTRFDRVAQTVNTVEPIDVISEFCNNSKIIVAGSTWQDDEELLHDAYTDLRKDWKLVIAPHEVNAVHIQQMKKLFDNSVLWSDYDVIKDNDKNVIIIDTIGLLSRLYQYADIAYIGGGFNKSGIHNILEAAAYGKVVTHGPNYDKFKEAKDLIALGSSFVSNSKNDLLQKIGLYQSDKGAYVTACQSAKRYAEQQKGATEKILNYIQEKLLDTKL